MSLESNLSVNNSYSYSVQAGPVGIKCRSDYSKELERLDTVLKCLDQTSRAIFWTRLLTFFRTGTWINEASARKVVKHYVDMSRENRTPGQTGKIKEIYSQLATVMKGAGTYADGINISLLDDPVEEDNIQKGICSLKDFAAAVLTDERLKAVSKVIFNTAMDALVVVLEAYGRDMVNRTQNVAMERLNPVPSNQIFTI